jgi:hypothetical protein
MFDCMVEKQIARNSVGMGKVCSVDPVWLGATTPLGVRRAPLGAVRQGRPPKRSLKPPGTKMTHMRSRIGSFRIWTFLSAQESDRSDDGNDHAAKQHPYCFIGR